MTKPNPWTAFLWNGKTVCYGFEDEVAPVSSEYQTGGTITVHQPTGKKVLQARELGADHLMELTPELRAAIEQDMAHQRWKHTGAAI